MNFMLNLVPLKSGGGVQVGLDFLAQARNLGRGHHWHVVASAGTPFAQIADADNVQLLKVVPERLHGRLWFEFSGCRRALRTIRPAVVHTLFGPQWPGAAGTTSVVGCAYSNLCYPEIDFWQRLPTHQRALRELVDVGRRRRVKAADGVVFETEDLAERAVRHLRLDARRVHVVRPSISSLVGEHARHPETAARTAALPDGFRVLLLSVYNPNKNFELLPRIARALHRHAGDDDTIFVLTLPYDAPQLRAIRAAAAALGVADRVWNFGPVPQAGCAELYRTCHAVILPSQLESFSNTIAESWTMGKPLLISDLAWARTLCGSGALYFRYDDADDAAARILELRSDADFRQRVVQAGYKQLAAYPTAEQRFRQYLEILEQYAKR
jgi:glycosyltransferase involved in cell wall biosynthesis